VWIISGYDAVRAAGRAHDALSSDEGITPARTSLPMMITIDRPTHTRLRGTVSRHFTRDALERYRPAIDDIARRAVTDLCADGAADAVERLAGPVPVEVIAEILGIPRDDRPRFRAWSDQVIQGFGVTSLRGARTIPSVLSGTLHLQAYFQHAFRQRAGAPGDDLLSRLTSSSEDGRLSEQELFWFALLLLVAGNETTTSLLGSMLLAFAEHPGEYERVHRDPDLIAATVEECLRFSSPIQGFYRTALRDYEAGETTIPAGARVLLAFGAANRDPAHYPAPDRFQIERNPTDNLGFGSGIHFCLGAHLARLEAGVVLRELVTRVSAFELAGRPVWNGNPALRALARLPLRVSEV
jgi:cytochrome P450